MSVRQSGSIATAIFWEEQRMTESTGRYTSGTSRRAGREMSGRGQVFKWSDELRALREDLPPCIGRPRSEDIG